MNLIKQVYTALNAAGLKEHKPDLVGSFTNYRTTKVSEMFDEEAKLLIKYCNGYARAGRAQQALAQGNAADKMRKKILAICHHMQWYVRDAQDHLVLNNGKPQLDWKRIEAFCAKYGIRHKKLNDYTSAELPALITQFQKVESTYK